MNIQNLEAFLYVHHFGSVNKAAEALFLTQPSVSSRIRTLEKELNVALFERVGRSLVMTKEGKAFIPYAESIVQAYKSGQKRMKETAATDHIVIGVTGLIANYVMPYVLPKFKLAYPNVQITMHTGTTEEIESKVLHREVDVGFVRASAHPSLEKTAILQTPIRLFVSRPHHFENVPNISMEQLQEETIVFYECGSLDWTKVKNLFFNAAHVPTITYEVDSLETAKGLILENAGIGFLPEICVRKEVADGKVIPLDVPVVAKEWLKAQMIHYIGEKPPYFDSLATWTKEIDRVSL